MDKFRDIKHQSATRVLDNKVQTYLSLYCFDKRPVEEIADLLKKGADVHVRNQSGYTPLMSACVGTQNKHSVGIIKLLLEKGSDINAVHQETGKTALHFACDTDAQISNLLISKKADVNALDHHQNTPLMFAAREGLLSTVINLLKAGATANHFNQDNVNALLFAVSHYKAKRETHTPDIMKSLIEHGASSNVISKQGHSVLSLSLQNRPDMVDYLLEVRGDLNLNHTDNFGDKVMIKSCLHNPTFLPKLLEAGLEVTSDDLAKITPLVKDMSYFLEMVEIFNEKRLLLLNNSNDRKNSLVKKL